MYVYNVHCTLLSVSNTMYVPPLYMCIHVYTCVYMYMEIHVHSTLAHIGKKEGNPDPDTIRGKRTKYTYKIEPKGHSGAQP